MENNNQIYCRYPEQQGQGYGQNQGAGSTFSPSSGFQSGQAAQQDYRYGQNLNYGQTQQSPSYAPTGLSGYQPAVYQPQIDTSRNHMNSQNGNGGDKDKWICYGASTFVEATPMFDGNKYSSRVKFSLVQHNGKNANYARKDYIDTYVTMSQDSSNGESGQNTETGMCVEALINLISSGAFTQKAIFEQQRMQQTGDRYPRAIFSTIGGSPAKNDKDGNPVPAKFRKFSITPSSPSYGFGYMFHAEECDGKQTASGGYMPLEGKPNLHRISTPVSENYLRALAEHLRTQWTAYQTAIMVRNLLKAGS